MPSINVWNYREGGGVHFGYYIAEFGDCDVFSHYERLVAHRAYQATGSGPYQDTGNTGQWSRHQIRLLNGPYVRK